MPTTDLRVLTVRQPFAWKIMTGKKSVEYRTWKTDYRGKLLIHVSSKVRLTRAEAAKWPDADVYGVILGSVVLDRIKGEPEDYEWCLRDPRPLEVPIRCLGGLGLWKPPEAVLAAIPDLAELLRADPPMKVAPPPKASRRTSRKETPPVSPAMQRWMDEHKESVARNQAEAAKPDPVVGEASATIATSPTNMPVGTTRWRCTYCKRWFEIEGWD